MLFATDVGVGEVTGVGALVIALGTAIGIVIREVLKGRADAAEKQEKGKLEAASADEENEDKASRRRQREETAAQRSLRQAWDQIAEQNTTIVNMSKLLSEIQEELAEHKSLLADCLRDRDRDRVSFAEKQATQQEEINRLKFAQKGPQ